MVNLNWLRTFCCVVETRNFTRASERLFMTQSGVSQHIRKLEDAVNMTLIDRSDNQITLTPAGERMFHEAQPILAAMERLSDSVAAESEYAGTVRIMSPGSAGLVLHDRLLSLQQQHSGLIINLRFAPNSDIEHAITGRDTDIGLMTRLPEDPRCAFRQISQEALLLVTPVNAKVDDINSLNALGFIDHPDGAHHANLLLSSNFTDYHQHSQLTRSGYCNQISLILEPVSRGLGYTILPENAVYAFQWQDKIEVQPLTYPVSEPLYLVWRQHQYHARAVANVMEKIENWLRL
ncbi:LysR family transcriptional regulator [Alteromonas sp. H39]|uniref:LysR family transcriptional regulator n=1 Tax=Alteromonas sp. H39 TaxID=3389876 RepID=UPI0039E01CA7